MINTDRYSCYIDDMNSVVIKSGEECEVWTSAIFGLYFANLASAIMVFAHECFDSFNRENETLPCFSEEHFQNVVVKYESVFFTSAVLSIGLWRRLYKNRREGIRAKNKLTVLAKVFTSRDSLMVQHLPKDVRGHIAKFL